MCHDEETAPQSRNGWVRRKLEVKGNFEQPKGGGPGPG